MLLVWLIGQISSSVCIFCQKSFCPQKMRDFIEFLNIFLEKKDIKNYNKKPINTIGIVK